MTLYFLISTVLIFYCPCNKTKLPFSKKRKFSYPTKSTFLLFCYYYYYYYCYYYSIYSEKSPPSGSLKVKYEYIARNPHPVTHWRWNVEVYSEIKCFCITIWKDLLLSSKSIYLSIYLSIYVYLSIHSYIYLSIYLSNFEGGKIKRFCITIRKDLLSSVLIKLNGYVQE